MDIYSSVLSIVIWTVICYIQGTHSACSEYEVKDCMKSVYDLRHDLNIPDSVQYFPIYKLDDEQFETYCRSGKEAGTCLQNLQGCLSGDKKIIEGLVNSVHYLCEEFKDEYQSYQPCYASTEVVDNLGRCLKDNENTMLHASAKDAKKTMCKLIDEQPSCVRESIEPHCGKEAADLQVKYAKTVLDPLSEAYECGKLPYWATILIIALVGFGLSIASYCIKVCCYALRNKDKQPQLSSDQPVPGNDAIYVPPTSYTPMGQYPSYSPQQEKGDYYDQQTQPFEQNQWFSPEVRMQGYNQQYGTPSSQIQPPGYSSVVHPGYNNSDAYEVKMSQV